MSPWQFTFFRILFGSYLAVHFIQLIPWSGELFGAHGLLPDASLNPTHGLFPNPLNVPLPDSVVAGILVLLTLCSLSFMLGRWRKGCAAILWFGWTALFHRNNLIANPSIPYIGLILILTLLVPAGEPWSRGERNDTWAMPRWVFRTAWILMAAGYSFSGITKLSSASWVDGSAMSHLLENPLARPGWLRDFMLALPDGFLALLTWGTLAAELLFLPLAMWARSRPWIWLAMVFMHLGIIAVVDFADLSLGMLMIHLFTFDPDWIKPRGAKPLVVAFDDECLMCSNSIRFLAKEDRGERLRFTTLQGARGSAIQQRMGREDNNYESMIIDTGDEALERSCGVLAVLAALGGHWGVMAIMGRFIPRPLRDVAYNFIARRRYLWFGKTDACSLPDPEVEKRLMM